MRRSWPRWCGHDLFFLGRVYWHQAPRPMPAQWRDRERSAWLTLSPSSTGHCTALVCTSVFPRKENRGEQGQELEKDRKDSSQLEGGGFMCLTGAFSQVVRLVSSEGASRGWVKRLSSRLISSSSTSVVMDKAKAKTPQASNKPLPGQECVSTRLKELVRQAMIRQRVVSDEAEETSSWEKVQK